MPAPASPELGPTCCSAPPSTCRSGSSSICCANRAGRAAASNLTHPRGHQTGRRDGFQGTGLEAVVPRRADRGSGLDRAAARRCARAYRPHRNYSAGGRHFAGDLRHHEQSRLGLQRSAHCAVARRGRRVGTTTRQTVSSALVHDSPWTARSRWATAGRLNMPAASQHFMVGGRATRP